MLRKDYNNYRIIVRELGIPPVPLFNSPYPPAFLARKRLSHKVGRGFGWLPTAGPKASLSFPPGMAVSHTPCFPALRK